MTRHSLVCSLAVAVSMGSSGVIFAQELKGCKVEVTTPKSGDPVGARMQVTGTATVPAGLYLWIFARKEGQRKWWPQGGGNAEVKKTGRWVADAAFGDENDLKKDAGATFEITAVIVDGDAHKELRTYVKTSEADNRYPGTDLPQAAPTGCSLKDDLIVKRR